MVLGYVLPVLLIALTILLIFEFLHFRQNKDTYSIFLTLATFFVVISAVTFYFRTPYEQAPLVNGIVFLSIGGLFLLLLLFLRPKLSPEMKVQEKLLNRILSNIPKISEYTKKCLRASGRKWPIIFYRFRKVTVTIHSKNIEKVLPPLRIPVEAKDKIREEVAKGKAVVVSEIPFHADTWNGYKYLVLENEVQ